MRDRWEKSPSCQLCGAGSGSSELIMGSWAEKVFWPLLVAFACNLEGSIAGERIAFHYLDGGKNTCDVNTSRGSPFNILILESAESL